MCYSGELGCGIHVSSLRTEASAVTKDGDMREQWVDLGIVVLDLASPHFHIFCCPISSLLRASDAGWLALVEQHALGSAAAAAAGPTTSSMLGARSGRAQSLQDHTLQRLCTCAAGA
jgi:hypothetical protein